MMAGNANTVNAKAVNTHLPVTVRGAGLRPATAAFLPPGNILQRNARM